MRRMFPPASRLRRALLSLVLVLSGLGLGPVALEGQISRADSAAILLEVADAFAQEGRWEIAEAIYERITERFGGTPAALAARERLSASFDARPQRMSRVELQVFATTYGAWLGVAVPLALGAQEPEAYGAGLLLGAPLGLLSARAYLRRNPVSEGQARAISWGGLWGTWQGFGWAELLDIGEEEICNEFGCFTSDDNGEELVASMVVGGIAGIVAGGLLARNPIASGISSGAQGGSIWGSVYGAMIAGIVGVDEGDTILATTLISGNLGLLVGAALADRYDVSRSRIRMMNLGALVGGLGGVGLDLLIQPDNEEVALAIPLATSLVGLGIAVARTSPGSADDRGDGADGSLLRYEDGGFSLGAPLPTPELLFRERPGAPADWRPGFSVKLFHARF
ncbi:MAG: hypothetical protein R3304_08315 [Longimicrobiales bacterium]|nr:hypothetical protein [Longimicrobiales bacterium]